MVALFRAIGLYDDLPQFVHLGLLFQNKNGGPTVDDKSTTLLPRERALELFLNGGQDAELPSQRPPREAQQLRSQVQGPDHMSIDDWNFQTGQRLDAEANVLAWVEPDPNELSDFGRPMFRWVTQTTSGSARSIASAMALADRQLRIERTLPFLETKTSTVPPCGHIDCIELMGCHVEASQRFGWPRPDRDQRLAPAGSEITLHRGMSTGNSHIDWIEA